MGILDFFRGKKHRKAQNVKPDDVEERVAQSTKNSDHARHRLNVKKKNRQRSRLRKLTRMRMRKATPRVKARTTTRRSAMLRLGFRKVS